ncbi:MAG TPA: PA14 domain-containing protein, partial [Candidatus Acidoferrum sp.]|nr:PA14 domain-containing protein [Candidatus Acidoferrum sp.]
MLFQKFRIFDAVAAFFLVANQLLVSAAFIETAEGTKHEGTPTIASDGSISFKPINADQRTFTWGEVRVASFSKAAAPAKPLPRGWRVEDIGKVIGSASDNNGAFTFTVSGGELKEKKYQPLHFAYRVVRGEPEVTARITSARGPMPALGGVMLREGMEASSGYALLGVSGDKHLRFESRPGGWNSVKHQDFGAVKLPIWLRIVRLEKDNGVLAFRSSDGTNWTQVVQAKLNCHNSPFPENSDSWMPRVYAGLGITAPSPGAEAGFQCENVSISCRGFLGEYFAENDLTKLAFARPDKKVEFWWGDRSPAPMLEPEKFSVRWRARLEPKHSEPYRFYCDAGTRLVLNGTEVDCFRWDEPKKGKTDLPKEIPLVAGRKYDLQFEFSKQGREVKAARLGWSSRGQQREHISSSAVSYVFGTNTPGEEIENTTNLFIPAGLWLRSGSFLAGEITASDRSATQVAFAGGKPITVLNHRVARLVLRPTRQIIRFELAANRTGMFLQNGDFLESELDQLNDRSIIMSSVLFGRRTYSRDNAQPLAVVMNDLAPQTGTLTVKLLDGSTL